MPCVTQKYFCPDKSTFVHQKLLFLTKATFVETEVTFVRQKLLKSDKTYFCHNVLH